MSTLAIAAHALVPLQALVPLEGFRTPGLQDFQFESLSDSFYITKPMIMLFIAAIIVLWMWIGSSRNLKVVPSKGQFFMEKLYDFIRTGVARDMIGHNFRPYIGILVGMFTFVLINNWFGEFFLFMFPTFSNIGYTWGIVAFIFLVYIGAGIKQHGPLGYLKKALIPEGVPWYLLVIIMPIEFLSNFITRPLTLAVRLFANMFAGHLSIMVFVVGGTYLLTYANNSFYNIGGGLSLLLGVVMMFFELFIGALQAYIFAILAAQYIASSVSDTH